MPEVRKSPNCPSCARAMILTREFERKEQGYTLQTFECFICGVAYTEGVDERPPSE